jgi:hypothetical protein
MLTSKLMLKNIPNTHDYNISESKRLSCRSERTNISRTSRVSRIYEASPIEYFLMQTEESSSDAFRGRAYTYTVALGEYAKSLASYWSHIENILRVRHSIGRSCRVDAFTHLNSIHVEKLFRTVP